MTSLGQSNSCAQQSGHRTARGQEFRATQSMELPLGGTRLSPTPEERRAELREAALHGTSREKIAFLTNEVFVPTADFIYVTETIDGLVRQASLCGIPGGMRVCGPGGSGKDAIIRYIEKQRPRILGGQQRICPILRVDFGGYLAPTDILGSMHAQLGSAYKKYQTISDLEDLLFRALKECHTEAIIFNEAQHMLRVASSKSRSELRLSGQAGDWLKRFFDKLLVPLFFFGVSGWDAVFDKDGQLGTRIPNHHDLEVPDKATSLGILQALDEAIPMPESAGLATPLLANPILQTTRSNWRLVIKLLGGALVSAAEAGADKIQKQDLSYSYAINFGKDGNPFGPPRGQ